MNKNLIHYILILSFSLLFSNFLHAQSAPLNTGEIKEYFELRDSIVLINEEMKKIVNGNLHQDFFGEDLEKNLNGCMLFLEQRIDEFSQKDSQMQYHYTKKLKELFRETVKLHPLVLSKYFLEKIKLHEKGDLDLIEANLIKDNSPGKGEDKLWHKPYFEPIDVRTLAAVSKSEAPALKPYEFAAQARLDSKIAKAQIAKEKPKEETKEAVKDSVKEPVKETTTKIVKEPVKGMAKEVASKAIVEPAKKTTAPKAISKEIMETAAKATALAAATAKEGDKVAAKVAATATIKDAAKDLTREPEKETKAKATTESAIIIFSDLKEKMKEQEVKTVVKPKPAKKPAKPVFDSSFKYPRPLAIMIENHKLAQPQTGLNEASLIYEIPVEGGITRFMGIYEKAPAVVGPVRSCREYFVDRALEASALYVHCGGSPKGYAYIASSHIFAIDEIRKGKGFFRDKTRKAPHNLYGRGSMIIKSAEEQFPMKLKEKVKLLNYGDQKNLKGVKIKSANIRYHANYNVDIKYDGKNYKRYMNGVLHADKESKKPLEAAVVVIQKAKIKTVDKVGRLEINFIDQGTGWIMDRGQLTNVSWHKKSPEEPTVYLDNNNDEYKFPEGKQVWVMVVSPTHRIKFEE